MQNPGTLNLNEQTNGGETALTKACDSGHYEVVQILCQANCDPNVKDARELNSIDYAQMTGRQDLI